MRHSPRGSAAPPPLPRDRLLRSSPSRVAATGHRPREPPGGRHPRPAGGGGRLWRGLSRVRVVPSEPAGRCPPGVLPRQSWLLPRILRGGCRRVLLPACSAPYPCRSSSVPPIAVPARGGVVLPGGRFGRRVQEGDACRVESRGDGGGGQGDRGEGSAGPERRRRRGGREEARPGIGAGRRGAVEESGQRYLEPIDAGADVPLSRGVRPMALQDAVAWIIGQRSETGVGIVQPGFVRGWVRPGSRRGRDGHRNVRLAHH
mmetsp:Transcript_40855/g.123108  ORF Transcript_40855/g.123108 Transcript_40855/m.123108 type:complete len:259 (-) Transcript_40855:1695-2471(-)